MFYHPDIGTPGLCHGTLRCYFIEMEMHLVYWQRGYLWFEDWLVLKAFQEKFGYLILFEYFPMFTSLGDRCIPESGFLSGIR